jgi:hypothetical protein
MSLPAAPPDELRSALRAFRAGLAGAYADEVGVLEANFRAAVARHGTAEAARLARTGHPEVGTLRPARTVAERARLLRMAEQGAAAGERAFELLGAPRARAGHPPATAAALPPGRTLAGIPVERIGRPIVFHFAEQIPAFLERLRHEVERLGRGPVERLRHVLAGIAAPGGRRAAPERVRAAFEAYQDEMARRTGPLPRGPQGAERLVELAGRFRTGLEGAYEDPGRAEALYHRLVSSDLPPEVAERVERDPALLGSLRDDPAARRHAAHAAGVGAQAYRIHLGGAHGEDAVREAAAAHEHALALGREAGALHDQRLRAARALAELDARERAAGAARAALEAAFAGAFADGAAAVRLFRQAVALRGAADALAGLRDAPAAFGAPAGRLGAERRVQLAEVARAALDTERRAAAPVRWKDPAGEAHAGAAAVRAAAARAHDGATARIAAIRAEIGPDGLTRHRARVLEALAAAPAERRAALAAAVAAAAPSLAPALQEPARP